MNKEEEKEYPCPNCESDKDDYRGRCPECEYEDKGTPVSKEREH